jgi:hypothetical protein
MPRPFLHQPSRSAKLGARWSGGVLVMEPAVELVSPTAKEARRGWLAVGGSVV